MKIKLCFLSLLFYLFSPSIFAQEENSFGASSPSSLPIPVKVDATDGKVKHIDVNWKHISNVTYRVYRSSATSNLKETHFLKDTDTKGVSDTDKNLKEETRYFYGVKSVRGSQKSKLSKVNSGWIKAGLASITPSALFPYQSALPNEVISFTCSAVASADQYHFQIAKKGGQWTTENGFSNDLIENKIVNNPRFDWSGTQDDEIYLWSVAVLQGDSTSKFSFPIEFEVAPEPPLSSNSVNNVKILDVRLENEVLTINKYFSLETELKNTTSREKTNCRIAYFLSNNPELDDNDLKIGSTDLFNIAPLETLNTTPMKRITQQVNEGFYWIITVVEEQGRLNKENYKRTSVVLE
jgi:hypothetical protein